MSKEQEKMVEEFQCPGCTLGGPTICEKYKLHVIEGNNGPFKGFHCQSHSAGTFMSMAGRIALGLPKGFHRYGGSVPPSHYKDGLDAHPMTIRLHLTSDSIKWDDFNIPVWALVQNGYLFVRTYSPRTNQTAVDVVKNGTLELVPEAVDVSKFYDEMD
jgi:hypothetical protein